MCSAYTRSLYLGQVGHLVVDIVEQHTGVKWIVLLQVHRDLEVVLPPGEAGLLEARLKVHPYHIALLELEALHGEKCTLILLLNSTFECDHMPPLELTMYPP